MIFTIDKADKTRDVIRKVIVDFFKNVIGFKNDDIIFIDRNEFGEDKNGLDQTKFSVETKEALRKFARPIFEDNQHGLGKQILNIAICEC